MANVSTSSGTEYKCVNKVRIICFLYRSGTVSDCGNYLILTVIKDCRDNLVFFANLQKTGEIRGKLSITPIVTKFESDYDVRYLTLSQRLHFRLDSFTIAIFVSVHYEQWFEGDFPDEQRCTKLPVDIRRFG